jgi:hypothetical protein
VGNEIGSRIEPKDLNGNGIERALLFLKLVPEFDFAQAAGAMDVIRGANQLRNNIVHAGGVLPLENAKVNQFVASHLHLTGRPGAPVSLQKEFVASFAESLSLSSSNASKRRCKDSWTEHGAVVAQTIQSRNSTTCGRRPSRAFAPPLRPLGIRIQRRCTPRI